MAEKKQDKPNTQDESQPAEADATGKSQAVLQKAATKKAEETATEILFWVSELAEAQNVPAWEVVALRRATGWAPGKQVSQAQFAESLNKLRNRPQGGGRI